MTQAPNELVAVLMQRDGLSQEEVEEQLTEAALRVNAGEAPEELLHDEFGLEPDYLFDLLSYC